MLRVADQTIKFEIVLEGRIQLDPPSAEDEVCNLSTLTTLDMLASKLLANSDRWNDDGVFNRDLIDLAMTIPKAVVWQKITALKRALPGKTVSRR